MSTRERITSYLFVIALLCAPLAARAELLANDSWVSGQAVNFQAGFVAGETAAVRLVPTGPCPCQVDEVRFLFGGTGGTVDLIIYGVLILLICVYRPRGLLSLVTEKLRRRADTP